MKRRLEDALQDCLDSLQRGEPLDACLARFPEMAPELEPLLRLALEPQETAQDEASSPVLARSRARLQNEAERLRKTRTGLGGWPIIPRFAIASLAVAIVVILSGGIATSAGSIPGDLLYPVKLAAEDLRLRFSSAKDRHLLEEHYAEQRTDDVRRALTLGRTTLGSFEGTIASERGELWLVGGVPVLLTPATRLYGTMLPGMMIEVEGETQPTGSVLAHELHLRQFELVGTAQAVGSGEWKIAGLSIRITPSTTIEPGIGPGALVQATLHRDDSGTLTARSIRRLPGPTATPTLPPKPTPVPSQVETDTETQAERTEVEDHGGEESQTSKETATPTDENGDHHN